MKNLVCFTRHPYFFAMFATPVNRRIRRTVAIAAIWIGLPVTTAAHEAEANRLPIIAVSAEGSIDAAPDMAIATMTVRREAKTARQALDDNNAAMAAVVKSIKAQGISDRDLQTSGFAIRPNISYPNRSATDRTPKLVGYIVQNTLTARIRDLSRLGFVLDQSVRLGVNEGGQIRFTNDQPQAIIRQARERAVTAALAKASTLAKAAGVRLGRIMEISERTRTPLPVAMAAQGRMLRTMADSGSVPIQAGENSYSVTVNMTWEISQ